MNKIVLYCKSYRGDVHRVKILFDSIIKYNLDKIPFYISCPKKDKDVFIHNLGSSGYTIVEDESIFDHDQNEDWTAQQVVKSSFWKLNLCENYLVLDSDSYFIRPFYTSDFIAPNGKPYTVMHEQKELFNWTMNKVSKLGFDPIDSFKECRKKIMDVFGRTGKYYDFGPSPVIWNSENWKFLEEHYLKSNHLTFSDVIKIVPSEFTWYGEWLLAHDSCIQPIEPLFKVFHYNQQYHEAKHHGYTEEHYSKIYLGIVMQSNANLPMRY